MLRTIIITTFFLFSNISATWAVHGDSTRKPESGSPLKLLSVEEENSTPELLSDVLAYGSSGLAVAYGLGLSIVAHSADTDAYLASPLADILLAGAMNKLVTFTLKSTVRRARPYTYSPNYPVSIKGEYSQADQDDAFHSFPSGHTSNTAVFLFSIATTSAYHLPDFKLRTPTLVLLYSIATTTTLFVGEMRVRAGRHFYSDVIAGGFMGTTIGILTPVLNHYLAQYFGKDQKLTMGLSPTPTTAGYSISMSGNF